MIPELVMNPEVRYAVAAACGAGAAGLWTWDRVRHTEHDEIRGAADRHDIRKSSGGKALMRRGRNLRPSLTDPTPDDLGWTVGKANRQTCRVSIEDSVVLLGPPRCGKGLHVVNEAILDWRGPVVTTSTRPDNLVITLEARAKTGPVAVFDPEDLAPGVPASTRWSLVRGCEDTRTAELRARALTAGVSKGTENSDFWRDSANRVVQCLLHAAAVDKRDAGDVYGWSLRPAAAKEAIDILAGNPKASARWHEALAGEVNADPRTRDAVWAMVRIAFSALAQPKVRAAVTPGPDDHFDPDTFLAEGGTFYLVGTSSGAAASAGLIAAFVEDIVDRARTIAATRTGQRLDPPLLLVLDEAANYPIPSLPALMSEGGGSGISTLVVLQSLAQARATWHEHNAAAIWDAATVKIVLGGGCNARDLKELSEMLGDRDEEQKSDTKDGSRHSRTVSTRRVPILTPAQISHLKFGTAVLVRPFTLPIILTMRPWTSRPDATQLAAAKARIEATFQSSLAVRS